MYMLIQAKGKRSTSTIPNIEMSGAKIDYVDHDKYLGITLDEKLNFNIHLTQVHKLVATKIYLLT